jgi:hypothetical protein
VETGAEGDAVGAEEESVLEPTLEEAVDEAKDWVLGLAVGETATDEDEVLASRVDNERTVDEDREIGVNRGVDDD